MFSSCVLNMVEPLREAVLKIRVWGLGFKLHFTWAPYFENALVQNIKRAVLELILD
jgi:hypothetical protein